ncbi:hypothetical protein DXT99_23085 [Pontibacter diazotrophicus]|uniref:Uncharacterized protein n=1 Tax=Pontibacter diazotrophicus TaxID=1400979 RepID=A0A3D8L3C5_9BACT|nr:hypothetical protein [Pontibacter diazotrophicus]RDV11914.1 hypothetical protein DXT99_23085 [Pontibacter diazotrophicus]
MDYLYMKIFRKNGKTMGVKSYSNRKSHQTNEDLFPTEWEILKQGKMMAGKAALRPAELEDGYYPIEHFKPIHFAAGVVPYRDYVESGISSHFYEYTGPGGKASLNMTSEGCCDLG